MGRELKSLFDLTVCMRPVLLLQPGEMRTMHTRSWLRRSGWQTHPSWLRVCPSLTVRRTLSTQSSRCVSRPTHLTQHPTIRQPLRNKRGSATHHSTGRVQRRALPFQVRCMSQQLLCVPCRAMPLAPVQARFGLLGLKDDAFPRVKLFKKGADTAKPIDYSGAMKDSSELLRWTVEQTGVFVGVKVRQPAGLMPAARLGVQQHVCAGDHDRAGV